ncbi:MAG: chaperone modulator CbpM [Candidatus Binatia bacterium]
MTILRRYEIVFRRPESRLLTLELLAAHADMHPALVERFVECGLIEPSAREGAKMFFDAAAVPRLRTIRRLRENLGINLAGIAVILDLLDKLGALQRENAVQRNRP